MTYVASVSKALAKLKVLATTTIRAAMSLTTYLQESFLAAVPHGWQCSAETAVFPIELQAELGFSPRVDVLLEHKREGKRLWIEFEVSRADPGANHLKFAVGHIFSPRSSADTFVSMVSNHVARGRANLGASAVLLLRRLGMNAFQLPLLPHIEGKKIKELNHLPDIILRAQGLDANREIERALTVVTPFVTLAGRQIFYAGNVFEVSLNVRQWNRDIGVAAGASNWRKRTITYFAYDPASKLFAPSKFCAFLPVDSDTGNLRADDAFAPPMMTVECYTSLEQSTSRFDGGVARKHLEERLGYEARRLSDFPEADRFRRWLALHSDHVRIHRDGPVILTPRRA